MHSKNTKPGQRPFPKATTQALYFQFFKIIFPVFGKFLLLEPYNNYRRRALYIIDIRIIHVYI